MRTPYCTWRRDLPHWRLDGATYFVTWRLHATQPDLKPHERDLVASALRFFDDDRYALSAFIVMNDHVHVMVYPRPGRSLSSIIQSWKSFTSHKMTKTGTRCSPVWQDEYQDRVIRSAEEHAQLQEFIEQTPASRWPEMKSYAWLWVNTIEPRPAPGPPQAGTNSD